MSPEDVQKMLAAHEPLYIIDVRTPGQYSELRIPGAVNLPLYELQSRLSEIPKDRPVVVYCASAACSMGRNAAQQLLGSGFTNVYDLQGGILDWQQKGLPTESQAAGTKP